MPLGFHIRLAKLKCHVVAVYCCWRCYVRCSCPLKMHEYLDNLNGKCTASWKLQVAVLIQQMRTQSLLLHRCHIIQRIGCIIVRGPNGEQIDTGRK